MSRTDTSTTSRPTDPPPPSRRQRVTRLAWIAITALLAVGVVVALAIVGTSSHHHRSTATHTAATDPNPQPTPSTTPSQDLTYVNRTVQMSYGGMQRSYLMLRPKQVVAKKLPVIIVLHGRDASPAFEEQRTDFTSVVAPSILVYPTGYQESWNAGSCCGAAQVQGLDDVGFVLAVMHQVQRDQPDASGGPAFLAGYSNGGKLALRLACEDSGDFAGIAVYGATDAGTCPRRPPSGVLVMGSVGDTQIPASSVPPAPEADGFQPPSFVSEVDSWRTADGCSPTAVISRVGDVKLTSWVHCKGAERVGEAVFSAGGHDWPAGNATSPSGEGVAWAWFSSLGA